MSEHEDHPHDEQNIVLPKYASFLREIRNTDLEWAFVLNNGTKIVGEIVDFLWDERGIPITIMIKLKNRVTPTEIIWTNITTITLAKGKR